MSSPISLSTSKRTLSTPPPQLRSRSRYEQPRFAHRDWRCNGNAVFVSLASSTLTTILLTHSLSSDVDASTLDVFDIGAGGWTRQAVGGASIGSRVNHCAVRASAKVAGVQVDHIFVYGGQQLNQSDRDSCVFLLYSLFSDFLLPSLEQRRLRPHHRRERVHVDFRWRRLAWTAGGTSGSSGASSTLSSPTPHPLASSSCNF